MNTSETRKSTGKILVLVVVVAILTAVVVTLLQRWMLGTSNTAVTGGVVGAVSGALAISAMRKKPA
jgi:NhaP-type Na+/H+ or K+/H+ antiporter